MLDISPKVKLANILNFKFTIYAKYCVHGKEAQRITYIGMPSTHCSFTLVEEAGLDGDGLTANVAGAQALRAVWTNLMPTA